MKKLIIVSNDSPDTGKSLISALLSFYLQRKGVPHTLIQSDEDVSTDDERIFFDLLYEPDTEEFIAAIDKFPATIFDISTGQTDEFLSFFLDRDVQNCLEELEVEVTVVSPVDGGEGSIHSLLQLVDSLATHADFVVAHNSALSEQYMKDYWPGSEAEERLDFHDAKHLQIPDLFDEESGTLSELACDLAAGVCLTVEEEETDIELVEALQRNVDICFTPIAELLVGSSEGSDYDWGETAKKKSGLSKN